MTFKSKTEDTSPEDRILMAVEWWKAFGSEVVSTSRVQRLCGQKTWQWDGLRGAVRTALYGEGDPTSPVLINIRDLAGWLRMNEGVVINGKSFKRVITPGGTTKWALLESDRHSKIKPDDDCPW